MAQVRWRQTLTLVALLALAHTRTTGARSLAAAAADQQLEALLQLKAYIDTTGILKDWKPSTTTITSNTQHSYCSWKGIGCASVAGKQQVVSIILTSLSTTAQMDVIGPKTKPVQGLTGRLPPAAVLTGLPALRLLDIDGQPGISGPLPDYSSLMQLQRVDVSANSLSGTLPSSVAGMKGLRVLFLHSNKFNGPLPESWGSLSLLEDLQVSACMLNGTLPAAWSGMIKLKTLYLPSNQLRGPLPDSWSALQELQELRLSQNLLTNTLPASWAKLLSLRKLYLSYNALKGPLPPSWGPTPTSGMEAMEDLSLGANGLTGSLPVSWGGMTKLRLLYLQSTRISGPLPASWGSSLVNLEQFSMYNCSLLGALPAAWSSLSKLQKLDLHNNQLAGPVPAAWGSGLRGLRELVLFGNAGLSGCVPKALQQQLGAGFDLSGQVVASTRMTGVC